MINPKSKKITIDFKLELNYTNRRVDGWIDQLID